MRARSGPWRTSRIRREGDLRRSVSFATVQELSSFTSSVSSLQPGFSPHDVVREPDQRTAAARTPLEDVVWRHRGLRVAPKTINQKRYVDSVRRSTITFGVGAER